MHYEGTIETPTSRKVFYAFITDPAKVISILPDVVDSKITDSDHFNVKARAGVAYLKGTLDIDFEIVEKEKDSMAKIAGHGQGMQSSVELKLAIALEDSQGGTRARWVADAAVGGLLASVAGRLMDGIASKYVKQITESLGRRVSS